MRLKRITTKEGDVYFVNAKTGERIKTSNGGINSKALLIITTIFAIIYLLSMIFYYVDAFTDGFKEPSLEVAIKIPALIVFFIGYYFCWRNELLTGIIFIFWWGIMWIVGLFIAEHDRDAGVVLGLPVFIIGILFIVKWYTKRSSTRSLP